MTRQQRSSGTGGAIVLFLVAQLLLPVLAGARPAGADASVTPVADSYVDFSNPTTNYGTLTVLRSDGSPSRIAYLKFDVTGAGPAATAMLELHAETGGVDLSIHAVADTTWTETGITANNAPPLGALLDTVTGISAGFTYAFDVSGHVTGDGIYALAVVTADDTAIRMSSREGAVPPVLSVPAPADPSPFLVTRNGNSQSYKATSQTTGLTYNGTLKDVVGAAVIRLDFYGGGDITFAADTFNLGAGQFELDGVENLTFAGQGVDQTTIVNNSSAPQDTEPFDVVGAESLTVRDLTVEANGAFRSTSDALDFDNANDVVVERVRVTASRGRGIVFDGKGDGWTALRNEVRDCEIDGVPSDGIEYLASSDGLIDGCTITNAAGHGIQLNKSSGAAPQPNKPSDNNIVRNTTIDQSGQDGININSGNNNQVLDSTVTNSADITASRSGIRVQSSNGVSCDDNVIARNVSTDNQTPKTQRYGVDIASPLCVANVLDDNSLGGNLVADFRDLGTGTIFVPEPVVDPGGSAVIEGDTGSTAVVNVPLTLSKTSTDIVTVEWRTLDPGGAGIASSSAGDFVAASGTVTFLPGETSASVPITVIGDDIAEPPLLWGEWILVSFFDPVNATLDPTFFGLGIGVIIDDD